MASAPPTGRQRRQRGRRRWVIVLVILGALLATWVLTAGRLLVATDDVERADAVLSLSGDPLGLRIQRAAEIFATTGSARLVVFVDDHGDAAIQAAEDGAVALGVPRSAVRVLGPVEGTADEAALTAGMAERCGWTSIEVVTSPYHTRRAGWTFSRALGNDVHVSVTESAEEFGASTWWTDAADRGSVLSEWSKWLASLWYVVDPPSARVADVPC